jgi:hypothetical protein
MALVGLLVAIGSFACVFSFFATMVAHPLHFVDIGIGLGHIQYINGGLDNEMDGLILDEALFLMAFDVV